MQGIEKINKLVASGSTKEEVLEDMRMQQVSKNFTNDFKYYILLYGVFNNERNIIKNWLKYEDYFLDLLKSDGSIGIKHLMQSIVLYFIRRYPQ